MMALTCDPPFNSGRGHLKTDPKLYITSINGHTVKNV